MAIVVTATLFILGMVFKKSKSIYTAEFIWMWILLGFCNNNDRPDLMNYQYAYNKIKIYGMTVDDCEIGYAVLGKILNMLGLDFQQAVSIMMLLFLSLIAIAIAKYTKSIAMVSSLFMIYPLFMSGIQIRNSIAMAIIVFSIQYLVSDKKYSLIKYCACVLFAMSFHSTALIYFSLILVRFIKKENIKYIAIIMAFLIAVVSRMDISVLRSIFGAGRYESKFFSHTNTLGEFVIAILWQITMTMLIMLLHIKVKKIQKFVNCDNRLNALNEIIVKINVVLILLLSLYYIDFSTERLYRNIMVLNFVYIANSMEITKLKKEINIIVCYIAMGVWYLLTCFVFEGIYANNWNTYVSGYLMENDMILHWNKYILLWLFFGGILVFQFILEKKKVHFVLYKKRKILRE